jgi:hypothetical protein
MSKPKFTPGPWGIGKPEAHTIAIAKLGRVIAEVFRDEASRDRTDADASLIAVAPEMFFALQEAAFALEQEADNYRDGDKYQPRGETLHRIAKKARAALAKVSP